MGLRTPTPVRAGSYSGIASMCVPSGPPVSLLGRWAFQGRSVSETRYSDAAKCVADSLSLHAVAGNKWRWAAFRLSDGRELSPGVAYDSRQSSVLAARWNHAEYMYLEIQPDGCSPALAEELLTFARQLYDAGFRIRPELDFPVDMPMFSWDRQATINELARGGR